MAFTRQYSTDTINTHVRHGSNASSTSLDERSDIIRKAGQAGGTTYTALQPPRPKPGKHSVAIWSYNNERQDHAILSNRTLGDMVRCNHMAYAKAHGYEYISPQPGSSSWTASNSSLNGLRYKTFSILSRFDEYDVIVWIDHDAVFNNFNLSIDYWIEEKMHIEADILMAEDLPGYRFNAGLQIIKTTPWSQNVL